MRQARLYSAKRRKEDDAGSRGRQGGLTKRGRKWTKRKDEIQSQRWKDGRDKTEGQVMPGSDRARVSVVA